MNIELVLQQLDSLFAEHKVYQVEDFLKGKIEEAAGEGDRNAVITLMNEIIGHFRETGEFDKSIEYCEQVLLLMKKMGMEGSVAYATTLLNVANAYRAAGLLRESMAAFQAVQSIYEGTISYHDFRYASLYNNMSLLFQEMGDFESACDCLERALGIATQYSNAEIEVAVTYTNLAVSQLKL
ncbi:MAG: tetratricopeptide repeat protein [Lachnospiraceae bacterium]|nr:tetratricopeptide repeat protein [Lachnospiraceae bacterium]